MTTQDNGQPNGQQAAPQNTAIAVTEKTMADTVLNKIKIFEETGTLHVPKNYSAPNALRVAWLILQDVKDSSKRPALEVCSKESVANALLQMVIQGLNPAKRQCSFVVYGNKLTLQREYQGAIAIAKRDADLKKVPANVVYKGDEFAYEIDPETFIKKITKHVQTLQSVEEGTIIGAYAVKEYNDGRKEAEIMTMSQIRKAWEMGPTKGQSPAHKNFPDQMAMKTVIGRALKTDLNSSDDSVLLEDVDDEYTPMDDPKTADVKHQIEQNANSKVMTMNQTEDTAAEVTDDNVDKQTGEVFETENEVADNRKGF